MLESRDIEVAAPNELMSGEVYAQLEQKLIDGEEHLVFSANGVELHRELAAFEVIEPAERRLGSTASSAPPPRRVSLAG